MINRLPESFVKKGRASSRGSSPPTASANTELNKAAETVEKLVRDYPAVCLGAAFVVGITVAWFIKRR